MGDKKSQKKEEGNRRHHLKKTVPTGSNAYLRICIFSKKITALEERNRLGVTVPYMEPLYF
jgi:hypothetical protein